MTHELKIYPTYFSAIKDGRKKFELRLNDRFYKVGDQLLLREFVPEGYHDDTPAQDEYSGRILHRKITYVLKGNNVMGLQPGYVILGLKKV